MRVWLWGIAFLTGAYLGSIVGLHGTGTSAMSLLFLSTAGSLLMFAWLAVWWITAADIREQVKVLRAALLTMSALIAVFAFAYGIIPKMMNNSRYDVVHGPMNAVYFSISTWTTLGLGDIHPDLQGYGRALVSVEALLGYSMFPLWVALLSKVLGAKRRKVTREDAWRVLRFVFCEW